MSKVFELLSSRVHIMRVLSRSCTLLPATQERHPTSRTCGIVLGCSRFIKQLVMRARGYAEHSYLSEHISMNRIRCVISSNARDDVTSYHHLRPVTQVRIIRERESFAYFCILSSNTVSTMIMARVYRADLFTTHTIFHE